MEDKYLTVSAITKYIKYKIDNDDNLRHVFLRGEISNLKFHSTGHYYLTLKDETSRINAIMFNTSAKKLLFKPTDGMTVLVTGRISVYESTGNYQIYIDDMLEDGVGNLYVAFEKLKKDLEKEGLFDHKYKKPIPKIPKRIGIITAPTGAAIRDILTTINRRFPLVETYIFPSLVQGDNAASDIVKKINQSSNFNLDVLIVGRGGGSIEDLWPFNEEIVARAIFKSDIPIISAVGHEVDFTISDFVADLRAPTPTAAAELAVPSLIDLEKHLSNLNIRLKENVLKQVNYQKLVLESAKNSFVIKSPMMMFDPFRQRIDLNNERLGQLIKYKIEKNQIQLSNIKNKDIIKNPNKIITAYRQALTLNHNNLVNTMKYKLNKQRIYLDSVIDKVKYVNPLDVLKRGYSLVTKDDAVIDSVAKIAKEDVLKVKFSDGVASVLVNKVWEE